MIIFTLTTAGEDDGKAGPAVTTDVATPDPSAEYDAIPPTEQVCTVLGRHYCAIRDRDELLKDLESRLWFTYRRFANPAGLWVAAINSDTDSVDCVFFL